MRRKSMRNIFIALLVTTALTATADEITLKQIADGLNLPTSIATPPGDLRLFITQQRGRISVLQPGETEIDPIPFLDVSGSVSCCDERGLLGLAFHPHFAENGFFYIDYTRKEDDAIVVARYRVLENDPNFVDATSEKIILVIPKPFPTHNAGQLQFGPDGYLYISTGDGGDVGDPGNRAQNLDVLLGKILRIDVDHGVPYDVPETNPFVGHFGARPEIWAYGLRNPWRFSFDRETGDLWLADVGQANREEIDFQPAADPGGENYGWRRMEGTQCYNPAVNCQDDTITLPVTEYDHHEGRCAVTGGYRYRGARSPRLQGTYIYADWCAGTIWGLTPDGDGWASRVLAETDLHITTFGQDGNGELYAADNHSGTLYAIFGPDTPKARRHAVGH